MTVAEWPFSQWDQLFKDGQRGAGEKFRSNRASSWAQSPPSKEGSKGRNAMSLGDSKEKKQVRN